MKKKRIIKMKRKILKKKKSKGSLMCVCIKKESFPSLSLHSICSLDDFDENKKIKTPIFRRIKKVKESLNRNPGSSETFPHKLLPKKSRQKRKNPCLPVL